MILGDLYYLSHCHKYVFWVMKNNEVLENQQSGAQAPLWLIGINGNAHEPTESVEERLEVFKLWTETKNQILKQINLNW